VVVKWIYRVITQLGFPQGNNQHFPTFQDVSQHQTTMLVPLGMGLTGLCFDFYIERSFVIPSHIKTNTSSINELQIHPLFLGLSKGVLFALEATNTAFQAILKMWLVCSTVRYLFETRLM
jgi:hypothetical protein